MSLNIPHYADIDSQTFADQTQRVDALGRYSRSQRARSHADQRKCGRAHHKHSQRG